MTNRTTKRKRTAEYQRQLRAKRDRLKQCRVCGDPAVKSERTGRLTKACRRHLGCDVTRKMPYVLAFESSYKPHRGGAVVEEWYPLDWVEHLL
jgi:hypothetical protein